MGFFNSIRSRSTLISSDLFSPSWAALAALGAMPQVYSWYLGGTDEPAGIRIIKIVIYCNKTALEAGTGRYTGMIGMLCLLIAVD